MREHDYSHSTLAIFRADELIFLFKAKRKTKHCRIVRNVLKDRVFRATSDQSSGRESSLDLYCVSPVLPKC